MFASTLRRSALPLLALCAAPALAQVPSTIKSTFEVDEDGWTASNVVPGGFHQQSGFLFIDPNEGQVCAIFAPAKFLGDKSAYVGGTFAFDGMLVARGGSPWTSPLDYGHVRLSGGGKSAELDLVPGQPSMAWETHQAPLLAPHWGVSAADFATILGNLSEIRISVESQFGPEQQGIDNVILHADLPDANCSTYNGNDVNPVEFACLTDPIVGAGWLSLIQTPVGTSQTMIALSPAGFVLPTIPNPLGPGELLVGLAPSTQFHVSFGLHTIVIPSQPSLVGAKIATQGAQLSGLAGFFPLNGILLTLGV